MLTIKTKLAFMPPTAFTSSALRARDADLHSGFQQLKQSNARTIDGLSTQLFELNHQIRRLCDLLGFDSLEDGISVLKRDGTGWNGKCDKISTLEAEIEKLKTQYQSTFVALANLQSSHASLMTRFQDLLHVKQRCDERYRKDYARYKAFKEWLFDDVQQKVGESEARKKKVRSRRERFLRDVEQTEAISPYQDAAFLKSLGDNALEMAALSPEKENVLTPRKDNRTVNASTRSSPAWKDSPRRRRSKFPSSSPSQSLGGDDTEDETQTAFVFPRIYSPSSKTPRNAMGLLDRTSVHRDETTIESMSSPTTPTRSHGTLPSASPLRSGGTKRKLALTDELDLPTTKRKRPEIKQEETENLVRRGTLSMSPRRGSPKKMNNKGKGRKSYPPQREEIDYSVYKGRGRYSKGKSEDGNEVSTINSKYTINPEKNDGLTYAFDQVVRKRDERKKLEGGDCEECRDYYDAIGPLPPRLQAPLWRSPSPSSSSKKHKHEHHCRDNDDDDDDGRQGHKTMISRHRHAWARAKTPPGYWDIGFPNTQKVEQINEEAKRMHAEKIKQVEKEVGKGRNGKWKNR